jgi:hypothetical protein
MINAMRAIYRRDFRRFLTPRRGDAKEGWYLRFLPRPTRNTRTSRDFRAKVREVSGVSEVSGKNSSFLLYRFSALERGIAGVFTWRVELRNVG